MKFAIAATMALSALVFAAPANSAAFDPQGFMQICGQDNPDARQGCAQYVEGVMYGYEVGQDRGAPRTMCPARGIGADDVLHTVWHFMREHPEALNESMPEITVRAISHKWPC